MAEAVILTAISKSLKREDIHVKIPKRYNQSRSTLRFSKGLCKKSDQPKRYIPSILTHEIPNFRQTLKSDQPKKNPDYPNTKTSQKTTNLSTVTTEFKIFKSREWSCLVKNWFVSKSKGRRGSRLWRLEKIGKLKVAIRISVRGELWDFHCLRDNFRKRKKMDCVIAKKVIIRVARNSISISWKTLPN